MITLMYGLSSVAGAIQHLRRVTSSTWFTSSRPILWLCEAHAHGMKAAPMDFSKAESIHVARRKRAQASAATQKAAASMESTAIPANALSPRARTTPAPLQSLASPRTWNWGFAKSEVTSPISSTPVLSSLDSSGDGSISQGHSLLVVAASTAAPADSVHTSVSPEAEAQIGDAPGELEQNLALAAVPQNGCCALL